MARGGGAGLSGEACRCRPASGCHAAVADGDPGPIRTGDLPLGGGRSIQLSYGAIGSGTGYRVQLNGPSASFCESPGPDMLARRDPL